MYSQITSDADCVSFWHRGDARDAKNNMIVTHSLTDLLEVHGIISRFSI